MLKCFINTIILVLEYIYLLSYES